VKKSPVRCIDCETAQIMPWRTYNEECPECDIRCIANMNQSDRPPVYELIEEKCGRPALLAIKEKVGLEIVRMRLLKEGRTA
jgi:hypothetical protein